MMTHTPTAQCTAEQNHHVQPFHINRAKKVYFTGSDAQSDANWEIPSPNVPLGSL